VIGTVPLGTWEMITFVSALRHNKMTAPMVIEGAMTGEMLLAYVEQCLGYFCACLAIHHWWRRRVFKISVEKGDSEIEEFHMLSAEQIREQIIGSASLMRNSSMKPSKF
jgi:hypothetical protein